MVVRQDFVRTVEIVHRQNSLVDDKIKLSLKEKLHEALDKPPDRIRIHQIQVRINEPFHVSRLSCVIFFISNVASGRRYIKS